MKWSKTRSPIIETELKDEDKNIIENLSNSLEEISTSIYKEAILGYIAGYIVRNLKKKITCCICAEALNKPDNLVCDYDYTVFYKSSWLSFINLKNLGGLNIPSISVIKIIEKCEQIFRVFIIGLNSTMLTTSSRKNLKSLMVYKINQELACEKLFPELNEHDLDHEILTEDMHSSQLLKKIINKYLSIRLFRYGKQYTNDILHKNKIGLRQQFNKIILFKGM